MKRTVLQKIENNYTSSLYKSFVFKNNEYREYSSYINTFSSYLWKKYTLIKKIIFAITIKGEFTLIIKNNFGEIKYKKRIKSDEIKEYKITNIKLHDEIIYVCLLAHQDNSQVISAEFITNDIPNENIKLAISICTYKREDYIKNQIKEYNKLLNDSKSPMLNNIKILIADNGQSNFDDIKSNEMITIYKNKNLGGAGGFTRNLIELLNGNYDYTHVIMMDDDVILHGFMIERTYAFLSFIREEFKEHFFSGGLASITEQRILRIIGEDYKDGKIVGDNYNVPFDKLTMLKTDRLGHAGWWYCVIPASFITKNNLPLPFFIHSDDLEYSLRNSKKVAILPNVCVWHEDFFNRHTGANEYYNLRNSLIVWTIYGNLKKKDLKVKLLKTITRNLLLYRYEYANLCLLACSDYLKGVDFLKDTPGEVINQKIMDYLPQYFNMNDESVEVIPPRDLNFIVRLKRILLLNGLFLKGKYDVYIRPGASFLEGYRAKQIVCVDTTGRAFKEGKNIQSIFNIYIKAFKLFKTINTTFEQARLSYITRISELTNEEFWRKYLNITNRDS